MLILSEEPRFIKDVKNFHERIKNVSDDVEKAQCNGLLEKLLDVVKKLDEVHANLAFDAKAMSQATDQRNDIAVVRKTLDKRLKDLKC
jgi:molecular chaperone GrpE (heat shock protein)